MLEGHAAGTGTTISCDWMMIRDAFALDAGTSLVEAFQACYRLSDRSGLPLQEGAKPFVDDGNSFWAVAQNTRDHPRPARGRSAHGFGVGRN